MRILITIVFSIFLMPSPTFAGDGNKRQAQDSQTKSNASHDPLPFLLFWMQIGLLRYMPVTRDGQRLMLTSGTYNADGSDNLGS